jgi:hypothetical protein
MRVPLSDAQERLESSDLGRVLISAFLVLTIVVIVALNLPWQHDFELKRQLNKVALPYSKATGLQQNWSVFAPTPRSTSIAFTARIRFADGSRADWAIPREDRFFGAFLSTRWRKWVEVIWQDRYRPFAARPTALWLARRYARRGLRPLEVTFVRRWRGVPPLGSKIRTRWRHQTYYHLKITPEMLDPKA